MDDSSLFQRSEIGVQSVVEWLRLVIESRDALVIAVGFVVAATLLVRAAIAQDGFDSNHVRLAFARHLALALEFQLAAHMISTATAPSWDRIRKLAAVAIIRTALNYFLMLELRNGMAKSEGRRLARAP